MVGIRPNQEKPTWPICNHNVLSISPPLTISLRFDSKPCILFIIYIFLFVDIPCEQLVFLLFGFGMCFSPSGTHILNYYEGSLHNGSALWLFMCAFSVGFLGVRLGMKFGWNVGQQNPFQEILPWHRSKIQEKIYIRLSSCKTSKFRLRWFIYQIFVLLFLPGSCHK